MSSVEAAKNFPFTDDMPLVFVGSSSMANVGIADDAIREAMTSLDRGEIEIYQKYRFCFLKKQNSLLKIGSYVLLQSGNVGKIVELIYLKNNNGPFKFVRVELFFLQQYVNPHEISTLRPTGNSTVVAIETVERKVLVYTNNEKLLCMDFSRPSFYFSFDALSNVAP